MGEMEFMKWADGEGLENRFLVNQQGYLKDFDKDFSGVIILKIMNIVGF